MPSLTIIVPTYNRPDYTILNINHLSNIVDNLDTEDCPISIIISDNCSDLNAYKKLQDAIYDLNFPFLTLIRHNSNYGIGGNILHAFSSIQSSYIMFCGDDDFLHPSYIEKVRKTISASKNLPIIIHPSIHGVHPSGYLGKGRDLQKHDYRFNSISKFRSNLLSHQLSGLTLKTNSISSYLSNLRNNSEYTIDHIYISLTTYALVNSSNIASYVFADSPVLVHNTSKKYWHHSNLNSVNQRFFAVDKAIENSISLNNFKVLLIILFLAHSLSGSLSKSSLKALVLYKWKNNSIYCKPLIFIPIMFVAICYRLASIMGKKTFNFFFSCLSPSSADNLMIKSPFFIPNND